MTTTLDLQRLGDEALDAFPRHGWARFTDGANRVLLPILATLYDAHIYRAGQTTTVDAPNDWPLVTQPAQQTLRRLAVALRELHRAVRVAGAVDTFSDSLDTEAFHESREGIELAPVFAEAVFGYLRRFPDTLTIGLRPVLFNDWGKAPTQYKDLVYMAASPGGLSKFGPICDVELLYAALAHSEWFHRLRDIDAQTGYKGIRDSLEHRPLRLQPQTSYVGQRPVLEIFVQAASRDVDPDTKLLAPLPVFIEGLCATLSGIVAAVPLHRGYTHQCVLRIAGDDRDTCGFWPDIESSS